MTREDYKIAYKKCQSAWEHATICEEYITSLEARIAELEDAKSCDGCKFYQEINLELGYCDELSTEVHKNFGCISYTQKDSHD